MLLQRACTEPGYQPELMRRLLTEKLIIIINYNDQQAELNKITDDKEIGVFTFDDGRVPIFTSEERIFDKDDFSKDVTQLSGEGEYLLKLLKGKALTMNPYSEYGKEFSKEEIERLLNGTYFTANLVPGEIEKNASVELSQPARYPTEIVKSLIVLFSGRTDVFAAYVGWINDPAKDEPSHYIFAVDTEGDMNTLSSEAIFITKQFLPADEIVDFMQINKANEISNYFIKTTKPFYTKNG
jgi:hypothetical protein